MNQTITILYSNAYEIKNDQSGVVENAGVSFYYLMTDNLTACVDGNASGYRPMKGSLPTKFLSEMSVVPGVYECGFEIRSGSDGKPNLKPTGIKYLKPCALIKATA